jgi:hypothetical protein
LSIFQETFAKLSREMGQTLKRDGVPFSREIGNPFRKGFARPAKNYPSVSLWEATLE